MVLTVSTFLVFAGAVFGAVLDRDRREHGADGLARALARVGGGVAKL